MTRHEGPFPGPDSTRDAQGRQLTIGECIAISRYGRALIMEGYREVDLDQILEFIDRVKVCTTCGWSKQVHGFGGSSEQELKICAHFTRRH